jgi:uncharacterized membrane protein YbhN (UPF0104 family)
LLTRLLDVAAALMIMAGLGMPVSPPLAVFALLLVEISNVLPTAPGQLGSFDAAVLAAAAGFVTGEQAVAFALSSTPSRSFRRPWLGRSSRSS